MFRTNDSGIVSTEQFLESTFNQMKTRLKFTMLKFQRITKTFRPSNLCHWLQATSLNCSHSFCHLCISRWRDAKKPVAPCPNCREPITSVVRSLVLDNYIDKVVVLLKDEVKERRRQLLEERKGSVIISRSVIQSNISFSLQMANNSYFKYDCWYIKKVLNGSTDKQKCKYLERYQLYSFQRNKNSMIKTRKQDGSRMLRDLEIDQTLMVRSHCAITSHK